jgi:hypothetical protein
MTIVGRPPSQPIRRPPRYREQTPGTLMCLGPAMRLARDTTTKEHPYICVVSHDRSVSIQGDTHFYVSLKRWGRIYYIRYGGEYFEARTKSAVIGWLTARNEAMALAAVWDVLVFANPDQLATRMEGM